MQHSVFQSTVDLFSGSCSSLWFVMEFNIHFNFKPTEYMYFNYEFYKGLQFIRVLLVRYIWSINTLTCWLKLVIFLIQRPNFPAIKQMDHFSRGIPNAYTKNSLWPLLKSAAVPAVIYKLSIKALLVLNSISQILLIIFTKFPQRTSKCSRTFCSSNHERKNIFKWNFILLK